MCRERLNIDLLDADDPFEVDIGNAAHLLSHGFSLDDAYDVWSDDPLFYEGQDQGRADWLMVGEVPGNLILLVPLAPPNHGQTTQARPLSVYEASVNVKTRYLGGR
jgi:hypothetical protein